MLLPGCLGCESKLVPTEQRKLAAKRHADGHTCEMALGRGSGCWRWLRSQTLVAIGSMATRLARRRRDDGEEKMQRLERESSGSAKSAHASLAARCPLERHVTGPIGRLDARHSALPRTRRGKAQAAQCGSLGEHWMGLLRVRQ